MSIVPEASPHCGKFYTYIFDPDLQPPEDMKSSKQKFAYCDILHSYFSHNLTPPEAKAFNIDLDSPACNGHYLYLIATRLWKTSPRVVEFTPERASSNADRIVRDRLYIKFDEPRKWSRQWSNTVIAQQQLRGVSRKAVQDSEANVHRGGNMTDFWQAVRTCEKVAKDEDEYEIGEQVFGKDTVLGVSPLKLEENILLKRAEESVIEPEDWKKSAEN
jgi:hypothetical protein